MCSHYKRRVVCELPVIRRAMRLADLRSATGKRFLHFESRNGIVGVLQTGLMFKLKARLVDDGLIDDRRFCKLNTLFAVLRIVSARRQVKTADILQATVLRIVV